MPDLDAIRARAEAVARDHPDHDLTHIIDELAEDDVPWLLAENQRLRTDLDRAVAGLSEVGPRMQRAELKIETQLDAAMDCFSDAMDLLKAIRRLCNQADKRFGSKGCASIVTDDIFRILDGKSTKDGA